MLNRRNRIQALPGSILVLVWIGMAMGPAAAQSQSENGSLDDLLRTVQAHWEAITARDRPRAAEDLIDDSDRAAFIRLQPLPMQNPQVLSMDLRDGPENVIVEVQVDVMQPQLTLPVRFRQEWIARDGEWRVVFEPASARDLFSNAGAGPAPEPDANEILIESFRNAFTLITGEIVIPTDAFGRTIEGELAYAYDGPHTMNLDVASGPEQIGINRLDLRGIRTGEGSIRYTVAGELLFENDLADIVLEVRSGPVIQEFRIPVRWEGRPAYRFTWMPASIPLDYADEIVLEVENVQDGLWTPGPTSVAGPVVLSDAPQTPIPEGGRGTYRFGVVRGLTAGTTVSINLGIREISLAFPLELPTPVAPERPRSLQDALQDAQPQ